MMHYVNTFRKKKEKELDSSTLQLTIVISTSLTSNNRLSRNEILSLPKHENLTTGKKYCGKYFPYISTFKSPITYIFVKCGWLFEIFFPQFCKSDMSRYGYLEVFTRVPWNSRYRESTVYMSTSRNEKLIIDEHSIQSVEFTVCYYVV